MAPPGIQRNRSRSTKTDALKTQQEKTASASGDALASAVCARRKTGRKTPLRASAGSLCFWRLHRADGLCGLGFGWRRVGCGALVGGPGGQRGGGQRSQRSGGQSSQRSGGQEASEAAAREASEAAAKAASERRPEKPAKRRPEQPAKRRPEKPARRGQRSQRSGGQSGPRRRPEKPARRRPEKPARRRPEKPARRRPRSQRGGGQRSQRGGGQRSQRGGGQRSQRGGGQSGQRGGGPNAVLCRRRGKLRHETPMIWCARRSKTKWAAVSTPRRSKPRRWPATRLSDTTMRSVCAPALTLKTPVSEAVSRAVGQVLGQAVYYNGRYANAVYHSTSCGATTSAQAVWGGSCPIWLRWTAPGMWIPLIMTQLHHQRRSAGAAHHRCVRHLAGRGPGELDRNRRRRPGHGGYVGRVSVCGYDRSQGGTAERRPLQGAASGKSFWASLAFHLFLRYAITTATLPLSPGATDTVWDSASTAPSLWRWTVTAIRIF